MLLNYWAYLRKALGPNWHSVNDVSVTDVQSAIVQALPRCPNSSCTVDSLATRVLKNLAGYCDKAQSA